MADASPIIWQRGDDGVVTLTIDDPLQSANTVNERCIDAMSATLDRLEAELDSVAGVILTSGKETFLAGGDLRELAALGPADTGRFGADVARVHRQLRRLETLGRPVVAVVNGSALGGGLELALACHHRIALDLPRLTLGLPEVTLGLMPGAGGVVRTVRMLGVHRALAEVLWPGRALRPSEAAELGLVDEVVADLDAALDGACAWIAANPDAARPWDVAGHRIPGGTPADPALAMTLPALTAGLRKRHKGAPAEAEHHILCAAVESAQVDFDTALRIETRYFVHLATGRTAKNMIKGGFFDPRHIAKGGSRPPGHDVRAFRKVAVLGAGMMGAGIAYSCAAAGMDVVLKDLDLDRARRGKEYSAGILGEAVARGRRTAGERDELLARITPTDAPGDLAGCDLVIEAVFEDLALKHRVLNEAAAAADPGALLCSNTSALPITDLGAGVDRPADLVGLHFFSPVDRMPLVEIIAGARTSAASTAAAFDVVRRLGKVPVLVRDSRGFFTSRVIGTFLNEGISMLLDGVHPASIEQASLQAGYPAPVLRLMDELTLTLPRKIREETRRTVEAAGGTWTPHPADAVLDRVLLEYDRPGRAGGAGFYDYAGGRRTGLWPGLAEHFGPVRPDAVPFADMVERMLFAEALETVRCFDEGVLTSVPDANVGSRLGIGFPRWTGGTVQYIDGYPGGVAGFVRRAEELADRYGERFRPPASLVAKAERGESHA